MELRTGRHVVFMLHAHLVFTTKRRGKVLTQEHLQRLQEIFRDVCAEFEVELREFKLKTRGIAAQFAKPVKAQ
jgi:putative transposase